MKALICFIISFYLISCTEVVDKDNNPVSNDKPDGIIVPQEPIKEEPIKNENNDCEIEDKVIELEGPKKMWATSLKLPASGKFVKECHFITNKDKHVDFKPKSITEGIMIHIERECLLLKNIVKDFDCSKIKLGKYDKCWTPSEGGDIGEGSKGLSWQKEKLEPLEEMFGINMMWKSGHRPKPGTKFLLQANGKSIVVYSGHETGPGSNRNIGGASMAIHHLLGIDNQSIVKISYLKNQALDLGPINCN